MAQGSVVELAERLDLRPLLGRFEAGSALVCRIVAHDDARMLTRATFPDRTLLLPRFEVPVGAIVRVRIRARHHSRDPRTRRHERAERARGRGAGSRGRLGAYAEVKVDVGGNALVARVTKDSSRRLGLAPGRSVYALVKSVAIDRQSVSAAPSEFD